MLHTIKPPHPVPIWLFNILGLKILSHDVLEHFEQHVADSTDHR